VGVCRQASDVPAGATPRLRCTSAVGFEAIAG
jgi:hypothetical protein